MGAGYGWPLKPFNRPHPVRGYFNDPRISGRSRAFHFGVDVVGADGRPVYSVDEGTVHLEGGRSLSVVSPRGGRAFGYWHVVPAVAHRQWVRRHQLLGHIERSWLHVHFAETHRRRRTATRCGRARSGRGGIPPRRGSRESRSSAPGPGGSSRRSR